MAAIKTILTLPVASVVNTGDTVLVSQGGVTKQALVSLIPGTTGSVSSVTATAPVNYTGTSSVIISMAAATTSVPGYLTAADWNTFNNKQASLEFTPENSANKNASGGYVGLTTFNINFKNVANTFTSFLTNTNTAAHTYTFPNATGIVALTSDISNASITGKVLTGYSSASGTVADTDTILQAFNKLNGNDGLKAPLVSPSFTTPTLGVASATSLTLTNDLAVADGGTGRSTSTTAYGLIAAGTTATGAHQTLAAGATTDILVGGGPSALPVWTTATGTGAPVRAGSPVFTGNVTGLGVATGTSFNTITGFSATNGAAPGTAGPGSLFSAARADHIHPVQTTLGTTQLNATVHSLTVLATGADWAKPSGYQTMVNATGSSGLPGSHGQSYFGYTVTSRRDSGSGWSGILTAYDNSNMWFTYQSDGTALPAVWRKVWHDGNDGAASGLDADLLDGQQGSYYAPIDSPVFASATNSAVYSSGNNGYGAFYSRGSGVNWSYHFFGNTTSGELNRISSSPTGEMHLGAGSSALTQLLVGNVASSVNYVRVQGSATGNAVAISAQGTDTNISIDIIPKGSGVVTLGAATATSLTLTNDLAVADGGTGRSTSTTAYGLIAAGTTATSAHQTLAAGLTTEILVGGGASALPVWTTATGTGAPVRADSPAFTTKAASPRFETTAVNSSGYGFWGTVPITYGTLMSAATDVTYGGRITGETTSDYNIYSTIGGGTNRGFVFRSSYAAPILSINPDRVRSAVSLSTIGGLTVVGLATPAAPTGTPNTLNGDILAGSHYARIAAFDSNGAISIAGAESALVTTTGSTSSIVWSWTAVPAATSYAIFIGATGAQTRYFTTTTNTYTQTLPSTSGTAGTPGATNFSGGIYAPGHITAGQYVFSAYVNMSHAATERTTDTVFYSSTDAYIRKNTLAGFKTSLGLSGFSTSGAFTTTVTITNNTAVTLPVSGTLLSTTLGTYAGTLTSGQVTAALGYTPGNPGGVSVSVISTNTTAVPGTTYVATANLNLTLPLAPEAGAQVSFSNRSGVTTCNILRNGQNIMGLAEDMAIDGLHLSVTLVFADATRGWIIV